MDFQAIYDIARHELTVTIRNRWTALFAVVFAILVTSIAYFGVMAEGYSGMQSFTRTSASLLNLVLYIVPLISLTMGTLSLTGDKGSMELLFSQPVSRSEVVIGKILGLFFSIALSTLAGFAFAGMLVVLGHGTVGLARYAGLVGLSLLLSLSFLSIALLVATANRRKPRAIGVALFLWFFFVIFYDLLAISGALFLRGESANIVLFLSLFGNPVDMVRVSTLIILENASIFGAAGAALLRFLGGGTLGFVVLVSALVVWICAPVAIACRLLRRQDV